MGLKAIYMNAFKNVSTKVSSVRLDPDLESLQLKVMERQTLVDWL